MKILLSTYSCFPCPTSEPGNAWRTFNKALRSMDQINRQTVSERSSIKSQAKGTLADAK
jgi:hypothetical protein